MISRPLALRVWHTLKLTINGYDNTLDSYLIGLDTQSNPRSMGQEGRQTLAHLGLAHNSARGEVNMTACQTHACQAQFQQVEKVTRPMPNQARHVAKPKGNDSGGSLDLCPIRLGMQPRPIALGLAARQTSVYCPQLVATPKSIGPGSKLDPCSWAKYFAKPGNIGYVYKSHPPINKLYSCS